LICKMKYLYLVDYWIPFPSSEYGGVISVIADNDTECHKVLLEWRDECEDSHDSRIMGNVSKALRFQLSESHSDEESRVVDSFTT
jgi:hypothetical protein